MINDTTSSNNNHNDNIDKAPLLDPRPRPLQAGGAGATAQLLT